MIQIERIAFLCHPYHRGGVTRWMADAAVEAARAGAAVWFVTFEPTTPFHSAGGREAMVKLMATHAHEVTLVTKKAGFEFEFGSHEYRATSYADLVKANVPAGVPIVVSDDMAVWAAAASLADRYPMVGVLHGDQDYYADIAARFASQLAAAVCVSRRVRERLLKRCSDLSPSKIFVIPCGVTLPAARKHENVPGNTRLAFVGRLSDYEKRAYDLVTICGALHRNNFSFTLDIVGSSAESGEEYRKKFEAEGVGEFVRFHGWQPADKVAEILCATDIVMLTSNSEGMPLVMMEALGAGCAFAGTRVSGIEDYEHHPGARNCLRVYTVGSIQEAAAGIETLANVPVKQRAEEARKLAEQEFTMSVCLARYAAMLRNTSNTGVRPASVYLSLVGRALSFARAASRYLRVSVRLK